MKTIITTLPIYDRIEKQCNERAKDTGNRIISIFCPRHRLPSFMYNEEADNTGGPADFDLVDELGNVTSITYYFDNLSYGWMYDSWTIGGNSYIGYSGDKLRDLLPLGTYYLKITNVLGNSYYSDWFSVADIYPNILYKYNPLESHSTEFWGYFTYDHLTLNGADISLARGDHAGSSELWTTQFEVPKGRLETLYLSLNLHITLGEAPSVQLFPVSGSASAKYQLAEGINIIPIVYMSEYTTWAFLKFTNTADTEWVASAVTLMRGYSEEYLRIDFYNSCDIGDVIYADHVLNRYTSVFTQSLWLNTEPMEISFPLEEEGQKNGEGQFIRTFARQVKKYTARTMAMPDYMVEVLHRLILHDNVVLTDLVGDVHNIYNLEVTHEWLWKDKKYAKVDLTFDYAETVIVSACCENTNVLSYGSGSITADNTEITADHT